MKIKWIGHAAILIVADSGLRIIIDPYKPGYFIVPGGELSYGEISEIADIVVISHEHPDHNNVSAVRGNFDIIKGTDNQPVSSYTVKDIDFKFLQCFHDDSEGSLLGKTYAVSFEVDGMKVLYDGDMGHTFGAGQLNEIGQVDILLLCVGHLYPMGEPELVRDAGGEFKRVWKQCRIDSSLATRLYSQVLPKMVVPIHYSNDKCTFKLSGLDDFLAGKNNVIRMPSSELNIIKKDLPSTPQIVVLEHAL